MRKEDSRKIRQEISAQSQKLRMNQMEILVIKNTISKMKNALNGLICRFDTDKARVRECEHRATEMTQQKRKLKQKNSEQNFAVFLKVYFFQ